MTGVVGKVYIVSLVMVLDSLVEHMRLHVGAWWMSAVVGATMVSGVGRSSFFVTTSPLCDTSILSVTPGITWMSFLMLFSYLVLSLVLTGCM